MMSKKLLCLTFFAMVVSLALASGAKAADPNLVGWWPLNEGSGDTAIDLSGNGNDGTISNLNGGLGTDGSVWVDDPLRGTVISFNGTAEGAFVRAGDIPQMTLTNDFTWAFWAKHNAENTADNDIILGNRMDENAVDFVPRQFIKFTPTKFEWHMNDNGDDNLDYDDIPADIWLHHAVVKTGDQLTYYRNGIEASSGTFTQPLDFPQPLFFGGDNEAAAGENWSGLMSEVRIYNRALTELEIATALADMEIGFAKQPPMLDGEVDKIWDRASTQNMVPLEDPNNASGSWKALYDSENLYVIVDVTDDSLQNDSADSWLDDSVEIYFDGGNTKVNTPLSGDDHQYTFGWTTDEIQGNNIDGATEGIEHAQVDTDTGWRIEIKMPWLSIQGAAPQAGDLIGIDCYYNDDDDGGDSR
ncbi:MAG: sugar-binding protein, partial [Sedimentisphaerales bacterium]